MSTGPITQVLYQRECGFQLRVAEKHRQAPRTSTLASRGGYDHDDKLYGDGNIGGA